MLFILSSCIFQIRHITNALIRYTCYLKPYTVVQLTVFFIFSRSFLSIFTWQALSIFTWPAKHTNNLFIICIFVWHMHHWFISSAQFWTRFLLVNRFVVSNFPTTIDVDSLYFLFLCGCVFVCTLVMKIHAVVSYWDMP